MDYSKELPVMDLSDNETGCCPRFHPEYWDKRGFDLKDLRFARAYTKSFFYMPVNMGKVMQKSMAAIQSAGAESEERYMILSKDLSLWKCEHNFLVTKDVPSMEMTDLPGNYYTEVFDGEYKEMPKWIETVRAHVKDKGQDVSDIYAFYTTCPKCAAHYGHNYVVIFAKLASA